MSLILASSSRYRQQLLARLGQPFRAIAPDVDEQPEPGESPEQLSARLGLLKARTVAQAHPEALVIGSDQVADLNGQILGKPGTHERAAAQLRACAGQQVLFHTSLALVGQKQGLMLQDLVQYRVQFRPLSDAAIDNYLRRDEPWDCAGSFRWESLGIALFSAMEGSDPTALEGLPLIALTRLLGQAGIDVLGH